MDQREEGWGQGRNGLSAWWQERQLDVPSLQGEGGQCDLNWGDQDPKVGPFQTPQFSYVKSLLSHSWYSRCMQAPKQSKDSPSCQADSIDLCQV